MAMSWQRRVKFEPSLVACVVSNPKCSLAALRATKDRRIAIPALKEAPQVVVARQNSDLPSNQTDKGPPA
jgi:flavin reductase (DIM6/NTAB) family NADH-FMN oxidoreductase RutF